MMQSRTWVGLVKPQVRWNDFQMCLDTDLYYSFHLHSEDFSHLHPFRVSILARMVALSLGTHQYFLNCPFIHFPSCYPAQTFSSRKITHHSLYFLLHFFYFETHLACSNPWNICGKLLIANKRFITIGRCEF